MGNDRNMPVSGKNWNLEGGQPLEDRALKAAAQFWGEEVFPFLGVEGTVKRMAPTEQVHLEVKDFMEDFNYEMEDGTWRHLEFESDNITKEDLRRFRSYEAITSYYYGVEVVTCVVCSSRVKKIKSEITQGLNTYHVQIIHLKSENADKIIMEQEEKQKLGNLDRKELLHLLLTPLMDGEMPQAERISRSLKILKAERESLRHEDLARMQSVLYTLAMKFLTMEELKTVREELRMTILGEMLIQDGIEIGIREMILDNQEEGKTKEQICSKLVRRFKITMQQAEAYIEKYAEAQN